MKLKLRKQNKLIKQEKISFSARLKSEFEKCRWNNWKEWVSLCLLLLTLGVAVYSIQKPQWISPQPSLLLVLLLSAILSLLLAKSRASLKVTITLSTLAGLLTTLWQSAITLPSSGSGSLVSDLTSSLSNFWNTITGTSPSEGTIYFAAFLIIFTWISGYICTWKLIKNQNPWPAVILGLIAVLVNLDYLSESSYGYFFLFIFMAILLLGFMSFTRQESFIKHFRVRHSLRGAAWFTALMLSLSIFLIGAIWVAPEIRANQIQTISDAKLQIGKTIDSLKINLFASVKAKGDIIKSSDQGVLSFFSSPNLSTDVQFVVSSPEVPNYWRVRRYDIYSSSGWTTSQFSDSVLEGGISQKVAGTPAAHSLLTFTVVNKIKTDIVLTAGEYLSVNVPVVTRYWNSGGSAASPPVDDAIVSVTTPRLYKPDESYTVTVNINQPTSSQLVQAGNAYPQWITNQYLQLPSNLPQSVKSLSRSITRRAPTSYDKVIAVKDYLSQFAYVIEGTMPLNGVDEVESFLIIQKTGNCTNFATAAVVLLRAAGIPARLATGYMPDHFDKNSGTYTIEARDYHAWPEVYFPQYGWVEFEVTPGSAPAVGAAADVTVSPDGALPVQSSASSYTEIPADFPQPPADNTIVAPQPGNSWAAFIPVVIILLILSLPIILWRRKFKNLDHATSIYAKLCFLASLARLSPQAQQTPLEFGARLIDAFPEQEAAINNITQAYIERRYTKHGEISGSEKEKLRDSWRSVTRIIFKRRFYRL